MNGVLAGQIQRNSVYYWRVLGDDSLIYALHLSDLNKLRQLQQMKEGTKVSFEIEANVAAPFGCAAWVERTSLEVL
jgi:hypothetical protein